MKIKPVGTLCMALGMLLPLTGCNGALKLFGLRHDSRPEIAVRPIGGTHSEDGAATRQGREDLAAGRTGAAIAQFQVALAAGEPVGAAANGLGVAYARLGRFEQAHRFFSEAIAVEPDNAKYRANLALLMRSPLMAERHAADFTVQVAQAVPPEVVGAPRPSAVPGALTRISRGAVALRTSGGAVPGRGPLPRTGASGSKGFQPLVRIEFSDVKEEAPTLPAPPTAASAAPAPEAEPKVASKPAPALGRTVHFTADARGFKPLIHIELGSPAASSSTEQQ
jgi:hypothetical protein